MFKVISVFLITLLFSSFSFSIEDEGTFYRDEIDDVFRVQSCGDFCVSSPNYFESYLYKRERNLRVYDPVYRAEEARRKKSVEKRKANSLEKYSYIQGISLRSDSFLGSAVLRHPVKWSRLLRDVGLQVSEYNKSFTSAFWREARKPILYQVRDWVLSPYRKKKLGLREKIKVWALEQTVDTGASGLNLDSYGSSQGGNDVVFGIKNYRLKFSPRVNPLRGRYGVRVRFKKYVRKKRPFHAAISGTYCNSNAGFSDYVCPYHQEVSVSVATASLTRRVNSSVYVSYQTESLNEDAYFVDGEEFDHAPWLAGLRFSYAFY